MSVQYENLEISCRIGEAVFHLVNLKFEQTTRDCPKHKHSKNSYEIHYFPYGEGLLFSQGKRYPLRQEILCVTGPNVEHEQLVTGPGPIGEYCLYIKMDALPPALQQNIPPHSPLGIFLRTPFWYGQGDSCYHEMMHSLIAELEHKRTGYEENLQAYFKQVLIYLIRKYETPQPKQTGLSPIIHDPEKFHYLTIEESFLFEYATITLNALSARLGLSSRQTERLLKQHYGQSFHQKKLEARMSAAAALLRDSVTPITDIAFQLGYSSAEHFAGAFKRYYGSSAREYRKKRYQQAGAETTI
ncbi:MAG: AraC family transcriptional regulator [Clostridiales bacterium]|nr:MAG: AraC family transcriptional regulator [Clostridiales bacterium]